MAVQSVPMFDTWAVYVQGDPCWFREALNSSAKQANTMHHKVSILVAKNDVSNNLCFLD